MLDFFKTMTNNFEEPVLTKHFLMENFNHKKVEKMINIQP